MHLAKTLLLALTLAPAAAAAELWSSADGSVVVEGGGFFKPAVTGLLMPDGLVTATSELDRVFAETRLLLPAEAAAQLPRDLAVPRTIALTSETLRIDAALLVDDVKLSAAWQAAFVDATDARFAGVGASSGVFGTSRRAPRRRLIDFDAVLTTDGHASVVHNLDKLALAWRTSLFNLTVGRQVVSWGTGRLWNPTDLFSPFAPTDVDREVRRGADAVRASVPLGATGELDLIWLPQLQFGDNGGVVRGRANFNDVDVSASVAKYVDDIVVGADVAGDIDVVAVYAEAAVTVGGSDEDAFARAVVGASARPTDDWFVNVEGYYNGAGTDDADHIVDELKSARVARGEVFGVGRFYVGVVNSFALGDLTSLSTAALVNLDDPSLLLVPSLETSLDQRVTLRVGASVPFGTGVDTTLFRRLDADDVVGDSAEFERAVSTFGARSEYGLSPLTAFVQLGLYFD